MTISTISQEQKMKKGDYEMKNLSLAQLSDIGPFAATEDQPLSIQTSSLTNGGSQTLRSVGHAAHGTVTLSKGKVVFRPAEDFSGIATFDYTLVDSNGVATVHTATIDVAPVADAPVLSVTPALSGPGGTVSKQGGEFLVNTTTAGGQFFSSIATFADGGFVMAWTDTSYSANDFSNAQVKAQVFDANGHKVGNEFRVNTTTALEQRRPRVSVLANGDFVVAWEDASGQGGDASGGAIKAQLYHANGAKVGGEFLVNTTTQGTQDEHAITALANGRFVVTWTDNSGVGGDSSGSAIKAQLFNANGTKVGGEFLVNTITSDFQDEPSVASLKNGGFVVSWQDNSGLNGDGTRGGSIKAQMFDADGNKVGGELLVDTNGINFANESPSIVGLSNGGFVVTWEASANFGPDTDDSAMKVQIFDASGNKVGDEIVANTSATEYQKTPVVTELSNGFIVVVWEDHSGENGDTDGTSIKAQVLDATGHRIGGEFLVNTSTAGDQQFPSVAALADGSFIISWSDGSGAGGDASGFGVKAQIFSVGSSAPNTAVKLNLAASLTDTDGSETLAVAVSSIPVGATLSDGVHSFTETAGNTSVDITGWSFSNLTVKPALDFTGDLRLTVSATATDHATLSTGAVTDSRTVSQTIDIFIAPLKGVITDETLSGGTVAENAANGTVVGTVHGVDSLPGAVFTYSLLDNAGGRFAIDANTGVITVADGTKLDFEAATGHGIGVQVKDQTGATFAKTFNLDVTNVNEAPTNETLAGGSVVGSSPNGTVVGTVSGVDPDAGAVLTYSLLDNANGAFAINANTGVITVADGTKIDFASGASRGVNVRVTDQGGLSFDKIFNIAVTDPGKQFVAANELKAANEDNSLVISAASLIADSTNPSGTALSVTSIGNASHGTVSMVNGNITFVPAANFSGIARFDYTLSDSSGHSSTATVTVDVAPVADAPALSASQGSNGPGTITRIGGEVLVNTTLAGGQFQSSMAAYSDGRYVIAWSDTSYTGSNYTQVRAQRFNADGTKAGAEFRVNTLVDSHQRLPKVAVLANGNFVVAWEYDSNADGTGGDGSEGAVKARVFQANGTPVTPEFLVNISTQGLQEGASITALANGDFVVAWADHGAGDGNGAGVKARLFHADGTAASAELGLNTLTTDDQDSVSISTMKNGGFVATWRDNSFLRGDETRSGSIIAQRFDAAGNKVGGEVLVDTRGINFVNESPTVTGLSNGGFVVVWEASANTGPDTNDSSVDVQFFDASGNKVGPMLVANTATDNYQKFPVVTELDNGFVVVVWTDNSTVGDPEPASIKMQVFDPNGARVGGEILVNTSTEEYQQFPSVVALPGGQVMVSWSDQSGRVDPQDDGIVRQIFSIGDQTTPNTPVKINLSASLTDTDGSETLAVSVSGIPVGAILSDGVQTFTATAGHTSVDITGWSFGNLTVQPVQDFAGNFQLTVNATATDHATLTTGAVTDSRTVSQTLNIVVGSAQPQAAAFASPHTAGGTGDDVLFGGSGNDVLTGGGGNDTYQFGPGGGQDRVVNGTAASTGPSGELDFGAGVRADQLWFQRNGNDLSIAVMGSHDLVTVAGWFTGAGAQLQEIKTADGMTIGAGVSQLVQAMATFSSSHTGFDPTIATQAPGDSGLQLAIATNWHQ
jgi:hypothetical protein